MPKFLSSVFLVKVKCKKLMPCKYLTFFFFMFISKLQLLKLKHSQILISKQLGRNGYQHSSIWNVRKVNIHTKSSFKPFLGFSACSLACNLPVAVFPPLGLAAWTQHMSGQGMARTPSTVLGPYIWPLKRTVRYHSSNKHNNISEDLNTRKNT